MQVKSFFFFFGQSKPVAFLKISLTSTSSLVKVPIYSYPLCYCHHSNENYVAKHSYGAVDDTFTIISVKPLRNISFGDLQYLTGVTVWAGDRVRGFSPATFLGKERKTRRTS